MLRYSSRNQSGLRLFGCRMAVLCLFFSVATLHSGSIFAQQAEFDSLKLALQREPYGSKNYVFTLARMALSKIEIPRPAHEHDSIPDWLNHALDLARSKGFTNEEEKIYLYFGYYYWLQQDFEKAISNYEKAAEAYQKSGKLADAGGAYYSAAAIVHKNLKSKQRSLLYWKKTIALKDHLMEPKNVEKVYNTLTILGNTYRQLNQPDSALYYTLQAIDFSEQQHTAYHEAFTDVIYLYGGQNRFDVAMNFANRLIQRAQIQRDSSPEMWGWAMLAYLFQEFDDHQSASTHYGKAAEIGTLIHKDFDAFQFKVSMLFEQYAARPDAAIVDQLWQLYEQNKQQSPCLLNLWSEGLGTLIAKHHQIDEAYRVFDELLEAGKKCEDNFHRAKIMGQKADLMLKDPTKGKQALSLIRSAAQMIRGEQEPVLHRGIDEVLAKAELLHGDRNVAFRLLEEVKTYRDSIQQVKLQSLSQLVVQLETQKSRTALLEKENQVLNAEQQTRQIQAILMAILVVSLVVFLAFYIDRNRILKSTRNLTLQINQRLQTIVQKIQQQSESLALNPSHGGGEQPLLRLQRNLEVQSRNNNQMTTQQLEELETLVEQQVQLNKNYRDNAEKQAEELKVFNYAIGHDLKTPLSHIKYFIQQLKDHTRPLHDDTVGQYLQQLDTLSDDSQLMIEALLRYADIEQYTLVKQPVNTHQLISQITDAAAEVYRDRHLVFEVSPDIPTIQGDALLLRQVFINLIYNAIKFTQHAHPATVKIYAVNNADSIQICVEDNGIGVPESSLQKIFQLFKTAHNKAEFAGHGIGLAICKKIMQRHDGDVTCRNNPSGGATFILRLPRLR